MNHDPDLRPPDSSPSTSSAQRSTARTSTPIEPHRDDEIRAALWQPLATVDLVLAAPARIVADVERARGLALLTAALLVGASLFTIPYGLVLGLDAWWRISALYLGSTLVCLPSLHVFSAFLGLRVTFAQTCVLALTIPAAAAVFTCGFAPILGFLRFTFDPASQHVSWRHVSSVLLVVALVCGVVQLGRCLYAWRPTQVQWFLPLVWIAWHGVFAYVLLRMAHVLGLAG